MANSVALQCRELRKTYEGKVEAVPGIDLTIYAGQCYGLLGPNGAGRATGRALHLESAFLRLCPALVPLELTKQG